MNGGILWVVGGVWTVRVVWGRRPGLAWGVACVAAALRWGSLGLGDLQAGTRLVAPTLAAGSAVLIAGSAVVLAAAVLEEAAGGGLRSRSVPESAAAAIALVVLVPLYVAPGLGEPTLPLSLAWWTAAAALLAALVLTGGEAARRLPGWALPVLAVAGTIAVGTSR